MQASATLDRSTASPGYLRQLMREHPLVAFFVMAYAFSWIVWTPFILAVWDKMAVSEFTTVSFVIGTFLGPTLSAFIMTNITGGELGLGRFVERFGDWRHNIGWYLLSFFGIPAAIMLGVAVVPGGLASFENPGAIFFRVYLEMFFVIFFLGGPLGEEPGWRGFALPRMQSQFGPLRATLLLGFLWACWHLPHFLTPAQHGGPGTSFTDFLKNFPIFTSVAIAMAFVLTWFFNHTGGSIFVAVFVHASINAAGVLIALFPDPTVTDSDLTVLIGFSVVAIALVVATRGRLGYRADEERIVEPEDAVTVPG